MKQNVLLAQLRWDQHYLNLLPLLAKDIVEVPSKFNQKKNVFRGLNIHWNKIIERFDLLIVVTMQDKIDKNAIRECKIELEEQVDSNLTPSGKCFENVDSQCHACYSRTTIITCLQ